VERIARTEDLSWIVASAYSWLRRRGNTLPDGTVFTPPWLANEIVERLLPGLTVVDLGAGSGMLTLAAARRGFRVVAIEEDAELAAVLDALARIMKLRDRIELVKGNALSYSRQTEGQIMANPPYTRHHSIPAEKKLELARLARKFDVHLPMTAGYYGYFMVYAWSMEWSKREVLLLPTNWLETHYGQALRQLLLARGYEISLVENGSHAPVFDHALTTACLVTTQPHPSSRNGRIGKTSIRILRAPKVGLGEQEISGQALAPQLGRKLSPQEEDRQKTDHLLSDVFEVRRGIATGHNKFFVLSRAGKEESGLPRSELIKILHRISAAGQSRDSAYLWVPMENPSSASLRRISDGERIGVNRRYLCTHRKPWWRIRVPTPPTYFVSYMGRGKPQILQNRGGFLNLNNIHGLYLQQGTPIDLGRRVAGWLASARGAEALLNLARHYYGGMWKLEPGDLERLKLPPSLFR
jgi:adenine-specific DNA-methyltransferase